MMELFPLPMRPYILVFTESLGLNRQVVLDYLDTRPEILNWYTFHRTAIFIISRHSAYQLSELFRQRFPNVLFIITEIIPGRNDGWLPQVAWDFINNPRSSGRW